MIESVHAILLMRGGYALQLRDNKPDIAGPGLWGLFGGTLKAGEDPAQGLVRELQEELSITVSNRRLFWRVDGIFEFAPTPKRWWFFEVDASEEWDAHRLNEGQAVRVFQFAGMADLPMTPMTREVLRRHHGASQSSRSALTREG